MIGPLAAFIGMCWNVLGHVGTPKLAMYSASKHALHGFFSAWRTELRYSSAQFQGGEDVSITMCTIGATDTAGARLLQPLMSASIQWAPAAAVAEEVVEAVARRWKDLYTPYFSLSFVVLMNYWCPSLVEYLLISALQ